MKKYILDTLIVVSICALGLMIVFQYINARESELEAKTKLSVERQQYFNDRDSLAKVLDQKDQELKQAKSRR